MIIPSAARTRPLITTILGILTEEEKKFVSAMWNKGSVFINDYKAFNRMRELGLLLDHPDPLSQLSLLGDIVANRLSICDINDESECQNAD